MDVDLIGASYERHCQFESFVIAEQITMHAPGIWPT